MSTCHQIWHGKFAVCCLKITVSHVNLIFPNVTLYEVKLWKEKTNTTCEWGIFTGFSRVDWNFHTWQLNLVQYHFVCFKMWTWIKVNPHLKFVFSHSYVNGCFHVNIRVSTWRETKHCTWSHVKFALADVNSIYSQASGYSIMQTEIFTFEKNKSPVN